ncbi:MULTISPECIES: bis(hydroxyethyl) terephthalate hydrolase [Streptomyces]|uniref:bis(hydroxyethyl) terephthalate hydrolase n=1 Tax=Streptomyces TaxID=1883 RepID=UPI00188579E5|nr:MULTISPECIES: alpha/beta hydrolase [Streptomyces]MBZ6136179.1 alpha/beta hydrolase [Streptomyces olivaceus]MBZ6163823.1 alpha/beta hydrolase [Streptomyces olivaceus]MBZ6170787.1 alpha/beta hydrolase [Streptomyces olivaceus]MBZ6177787.1 alpha/beta hydrolase [Streptomyces olivaceus]MBZ6247120.1 alpha/beta hydrolase [Streptomyces olivaceus]
MQRNPRTRATRRRFAGVTAAVAAVLALSTLTGPGAQAADNPYERGPAPTESSIEAPRGSYSVADTRVSSLAVTGFGGGTIYYPTSTADGTFGAVVISPGYTAYQSSIAWLGPRLASQGFVVFTIDTNTTLDQPDSRGRQLLAALDYLTGRSSVRARIDSSRLGVMGHSMGGGGSLEAAKSRPSLQAAIPLTPWNLDKTWPEVSTPTLVVGADGDTIAPVASHAEPFYSSLPSATDRAYLELNNATHFSPNTSNTTIAKYSISWLKRFIDNDTRYEQFLCPLPRPSLTIEEYRGNCPHGS